LQSDPGELSLTLAGLVDIHVRDLANAIVLMVEEALKPNGGAATWGPQGYYFVEAGEFAWREISAELAHLLHAQAKIASSEVDKITVEEATKVHWWAPVLWGGNSRSRASRIRTLEWIPDITTVSPTLPEMIQQVLK
jgi:hypothetical protein